MPTSRWEPRGGGSLSEAMWDTLGHPRTSLPAPHAGAIVGVTPGVSVGDLWISPVLALL